MRSFRKTAALVLAASMLMTACSRQEVPAAEPEVLAVAAAAVEKGTMTHESAFSGRVAPAESVAVIGKASGTVKKTYFEVGDTVKAGDLLYEIDPVDIMLSVNQAQAAYEAAAAQVELQTGSSLDAQELQAKTSEEQAYIGYQAARDAYNDLKEAVEDMDTMIGALQNMPASELAKATYNASATPTDVKVNELSNQTKRAIKKSGLSVEDYTNSDGTSFDAAGYKADMLASLRSQRDSLEKSMEQAKTARRQAVSGYNSASDAVDLTTGKASEQAKNAAEASLGQARAALALAMAQVDYCKVTTPISGVVEMKNVEANGMSGAGSPAYLISNKDTMQVSFGVPAETSRKLQIGDAVTVENGRITHTAVITEIGTMVDSASGLFKIKANVTDDCGDLLTGIAVKLNLVTDRAEDALMIPVSAVYYDDGRAYVYVVRDDTAVKTFIETGIFNDDAVQVTSGLSEGDRVVTTWDAHLRNGMLISVKEG